ncbi:hypothetical protein CPC08DRAFT_766469 [Agrocybe pediades]|nr:hypothetical protein CPC08DRAFT_766469 [Agrocybe pediades]
MQKLPFDGLQFALFQTLLVAVIVPGQPRISQVACLAAVVPISYHLITKTSTGDPAGDLGLGSAILTQILVALDLVFFTDPNTLKNLEKPKESTRITEQPFSRRLRWALDLYTNVRGIGWAHEAPLLPERPAKTMTRRKFLMDRLAIVASCGALELALTVMSASNPRMTATDNLAGYSWYWKVLGVSCFGIAGASRIEAMYCMLSMAIVGLGFSSPHRWPRAFGSPLDAWSVQRFWRRVWHQNLRKSALGCTEFILAPFSVFDRTKVPSQPQLNTRTKLARLYVAFTITGVVHIGGEYMLLGKMGWGSFTFFALQAVGISIEKVVSACYHVLERTPQVDHPTANAHGHSSGGHPTQENATAKPNGAGSVGKGPEKREKKTEMWVRCIGYIWVILWFSWSASYMVDPIISTGMFVHPWLDLRRRGEWWFV